MKIRCVRDDLLKGIQIAQKGISSKNTLPILSSLLIDAGDKNITLTGTDLEMLVNYEFPGKIVEKGRVVIPARLIGDIVRNLSEEAVEITYNTAKQTIDIKCGKSFFTIKTIPAEDFPKAPEVNKKESLSVDKEVFIDILKRIIKATSKDESRPVLTGILIDIKKDKLTMVATDSYRLAVTERNIEEKVKEEKRVIVPTRTLEEIIKIATAVEEGKVKVSLSENHIIFDLKNTKIISRLIEGQYPNYKQLFPDDYQVELPVKREELAGAVKRVSLLAQNNTHIKLDLKKDEIDISAETQEIGKAEEKVGVKYEGKDINIAFNSQYLLDGLTALDEEEVILKLLDPLKPGLIKPLGSENFLYLIMPVRT